MPRLTGRVIAGRYNLTEPIGRGAMGVVWRARDSLLDRDVAIKEVFFKGAISDEDRENAYKRTMREARTAARLSHHGVVTIYDVAEEDGRPWIIMEFVPSRSLEKVLASDGPISPRRACRVGQQLLAALAHAHAAGVLHRDVKPGNVLIADDPDGERAVLTDFGIAQFAGDPRMTQTGMVMGSPGFTAPERIRGGTATPASDLWSLGATLFAAVEGRGPYGKRGGAITTMTAIINEDAPTAAAAGPLGPLIAALLHRNPRLRPPANAAGRMFARVLPLLPSEPVPALRAPKAIPGPAAGSTSPDAAHTAADNAAETAASDDRADADSGDPEVSTATAAGDTVKADCTPPASVPVTNPPARDEDAHVADESAEDAQAEAEDPPAGEDALTADTPEHDVPVTDAVSRDTDAVSGDTDAVSGDDPGEDDVSRKDSSPEEPLEEDGPREDPLNAEVPDEATSGAEPAEPPAEPPGESVPAERAEEPPTLVAIGSAAIGSAAMSPAAMSPAAAGPADDSPTRPQPLGSLPLGPLPSAPARPRGRRRGQAVAAVVVLVVLAVIGTAVALMTSHGLSTIGNTASAGTDLPGAVKAIDSPAPDTPAGWRTQTVSPADHGTAGGFSVAVPPGWAVRQQAAATYLDSPDGNRYLDVDLTQHHRGDMLAEARYIEHTALAEGHLPGYRRLGLRRVTIRGTGAAFWSFTWTTSGGVTMEVNDLLFDLPTSTGTQSYAVYFTAPASQFPQSQGLPLFDQVLQTFQPITN